MDRLGIADQDPYLAAGARPPGERWHEPAVANEVTQGEAHERDVMFRPFEQLDRIRCARVVTGDIDFDSVRVAGSSCGLCRCREFGPEFLLLNPECAGESDPVFRVRSAASQPPSNGLHIDLQQVRELVRIESCPFGSVLEVWVAIWHGHLIFHRFAGSCP